MVKDYYHRVEEITLMVVKILNQLYKVPFDISVKKNRFEANWQKRSVPFSMERRIAMSGYCAFASMDKQELQELSHRGGTASGIARREKRAAIEREKVTNTALREMKAEMKRQDKENLRIISRTLRMLKEIQKELNL